METLLDKAYVVKSIKDKIEKEGKTEAAAAAEFDVSTKEFARWEAQIDTLDKAINGTLAPREPIWWRAYANMAVGALGLWFAWYIQSHSLAHSSFVFLLTVLGLAVFLYGTGTQSQGTFRSPGASGLIYEGSIAGGAGLLALGIGYGVLMMEREVKSAFLGQFEVIRLNIRAAPIEASHRPNFAKFLPIVRYSSAPVPATYREGDVFAVYLLRPSYGDRLNEFEIGIGLQAVDARDPYTLDSNDIKIASYIGIASYCYITLQSDRASSDAARLGKRCSDSAAINAYLNERQSTDLPTYDVALNFDFQYQDDRREGDVLKRPDESNFNRDEFEKAQEADVVIARPTAPSVPNAQEWPQ